MPGEILPADLPSCLQHTKVPIASQQPQPTPHPMLSRTFPGVWWTCLGRSCPLTCPATCAPRWRPRYQSSCGPRSWRPWSTARYGPCRTSACTRRRCISQVGASETRGRGSAAATPATSVEPVGLWHLQRLFGIFSPAHLRPLPRPALTRTSLPIPPTGALLLGDSFNMRHPLTGGGMTVALSDCKLLCDLLQPLPRSVGTLAGSVGVLTWASEDRLGCSGLSGAFLLCCKAPAVWHLRICSRQRLVPCRD